MHKHRAKTSKGPYGCAGSVAYIEVCSCGAQRRVCDCYQCTDQGTHRGEWRMPKCDACGLRHATDRACAAVHA